MANGPIADPKVMDEAPERLHEARRQKVNFELDMREAYFFSAPHRARNVLSNVETPKVKPRDAADLTSSFPFELTSDFPTVIMNTFMPEATPWAKRVAGVNIPDAQKDQINKLLAAGDEAIFAAIAASNFYEASGTSFNPDLAIGTVGLWVERIRAGSPIVCQPIPIRELEVNTGPYGGEVDDRFAVRFTRNRYVKLLTRGISLPEKIQKELDKEPAGRTSVAWGFWRDWSDENNVVWNHVIMVKDHVIKHIKITGEGSCPLIVARFNPSPEWSWGVGPLIQALPDLRYNDALSSGKIENIDLNLKPPIGWPDDSFANLEQGGIETGMAYPLRPGTEGAVKPIYEAQPADQAIYATQDLEQRLRRLFYLDWPQQRGDTPPTATQWLDEMTKAQQRIGTPGRVFWLEFCGGVFMRFAHLLERDGIIQKVKVDGKQVALRAVNPAQIAAEQQEVAMFARFAQIGGGVAPEEFKMWTDGEKTLDNLAKKLNADKIWVKRSPDAVNNAVAQIAKLQQGTAPSAPAVPASPAGAPVPPDMSGAAPNNPIYEERGKAV